MQACGVESFRREVWVVSGVGYAATIMAAWLNTYYIVVLAWAVFYLVYRCEVWVVAGVGYAATIMAAWLNTYYIVVLAWAVFYLVHSLTPVLPWASCGQPWNTPHCLSEYDRDQLPLTCLNGSAPFEVTGLLSSYCSLVTAL